MISLNRIIEEDTSKFMGHIPPVSLENEISAWKLIATTADKDLSHYNTTFEDDKALLL